MHYREVNCIVSFIFNHGIIIVMVVYLWQIPRGVNKDDVVHQLEAFKKLLMNKKFVHTMVKTLESNPQKFGIPDRYS